eukprot:297903-Karenia_brevis.AAC.1
MAMLSQGKEAHRSCRGHYTGPQQGCRSKDLSKGLHTGDALDPTSRADYPIHPSARMPPACPHIPVYTN